MAAGGHTCGIQNLVNVGKKIKPVSVWHLYAHPGGEQETTLLFKDGPGHWARWPELSLYIRLTH